MCDPKYCFIEFVEVVTDNCKINIRTFSHDKSSKTQKAYFRHPMLFWFVNLMFFCRWSTYHDVLSSWLFRLRVSYKQCFHGKDAWAYNCWDSSQKRKHGVELNLNKSSVRLDSKADYTLRSDVLVADGCWTLSSWADEAQVTSLNLMFYLSLVNCKIFRFINDSRVTKSNFEFLEGDRW